MNDCQNKVTLGNAGSALRVAAELTRQAPDTYRAYRCRICRQFHLRCQPKPQPQQAPAETTRRRFARKFEREPSPGAIHPDHMTTGCRRVPRKPSLDHYDQCSDIWG